MDKKISNVNLHDEALTIFKKMEPTKSEAKAKDVASDYNARRKAQTEALRPVLTEMQARFEKGETIGASASMKEWCATYKDHGAFTYARVRQIITGKSGNEGKVKSGRSLDLIAAHFNNVEFNANEAYCVVEFEQKRELKYQGKRRGNSDFSMAEDNNNATHKEYEALKKENKIVWTHTVREISGNVIITVENEDGTMTEKQLVAALRKKMTATLKSIRLWDKGLTNEFNALVKDTTDYHEEKHEERSRSAKKAAETRAKKKPTQPADETIHIRHRFHSNHTICGKKAKVAGGRQLLALVDELKIDVPEDGDRRREIIAASTCEECKATLASGNGTPNIAKKKPTAPYPYETSQAVKNLEKNRANKKLKTVDPRNDVLKEFKAAKKRLNKAIREFTPLSQEQVAANENRSEPHIEWLRDGKVTRSLSGKEFEAEYDRLEKEFHEAHAAFTPIAEKAKALGLLEAKPSVTLVVTENCPTTEEAL